MSQPPPSPRVWRVPTARLVELVVFAAIVTALFQEPALQWLGLVSR